MSKEEISQKIEALLFIYGEAMPLKQLAQILNIKADKIKEAAVLLQKTLEDQERALILIHKDSKLQLVTRPEFAPFLEDLLKSETRENLSPVSLETLSIITYASPIARSQIDYIRGVNSSFTLRSLLLRGLIERKIDPKRKNTFLYSPSFDFLKHLGISSVKELPEYDKFSSLVNKLYEEEKPNDEENPSADSGSGEDEQEDA